MGDFTVLRRIRCGWVPRGKSDAPCVVAIPARNEEAGIVRCLDALERLEGRAEALRHVLLLLNGCTDSTWDAVLSWSRNHRLPVWMFEVSLPDRTNHAGGARAAALRLSLDSLEGIPDGVVLTTDADTRVPTDWLQKALEGVDAGCDVIAGDVDIEAAALSLWPESLRRRVLHEDRYALLLDEVDALCDPVPHNPWPTHRRCSGANLVFRASALRALPHLPAPACGEDRALVAACLAHDLRVRHDPGFRVETSGRLLGRARGGMADTLRLRQSRLDLPCDPMLEAFAPHARRATLRAGVRRIFTSGAHDRMLAEAVGLDLPGRAAHSCRYFGEAWQRLERLCPSLRRHPVSPAMLASEADRARAWLRAHRAGWSEEVAA